ncbi:hypothetical protein GGR00_005487 [Aminobacter aganoensis]|uniref:Uncharacterized protein n=1 Tax=Aminobacter aganoensis TaxID=83264 RepID=A0A7X0FE40_9HYPH|nr:hypothetical protein [Aminobacter aganoensis]
MKEIRASPYRLGAHEFLRAMRSMTKFVEPEKIFADLSEARRRSANACGKGLLYSILLLMIISSTDSNLLIRIKTPISDISIMKIYAVFALSVISSFSIIELVNCFTLNEYQRIFSDKILNFDNASARATIYDPSSAWSHGLSIQFRFLSTNTYHAIKSIIVISILFLPVIISYIIIYYYCFSFMSEYILGHSYVAFGDALSIISIISMIAPFSIVLFLAIPINLKRNNSFIRWIFLLRIYRRAEVRRMVPNRWLTPKT